MTLLATLTAPRADRIEAAAVMSTYLPLVDSFDDVLSSAARDTPLLWVHGRADPYLTCVGPPSRPSLPFLPPQSAYPDEERSEPTGTPTPSCRSRASPPRPSACRTWPSAGTTACSTRGTATCSTTSRRGSRTRCRGGAGPRARARGGRTGGERRRGRRRRERAWRERRRGISTRATMRGRGRGSARMSSLTGSKRRRRRRSLLLPRRTTTSSLSLRGARKEGGEVGDGTLCCGPSGPHGHRRSGVPDSLVVSWCCKTSLARVAASSQERTAPIAAKDMSEMH